MNVLDRLPHDALVPGAGPGTPPFAPAAVAPDRTGPHSGRTLGRTGGAPRGRAGQPCDWPMFTIHAMPNRSTHMPNSSPHICVSRGTDTAPLSESFSQ